MQITRENLASNLSDAMMAVLGMAKESSWNKISNNCKFIISEIKPPLGNFFDEARIRKLKNDKKTPEILRDVISDLLNVYPNIYDINLYIYKSFSDLTIVEIQYYPKSLLEAEYRITVAENPPMLHCKVAIPPYCFGTTDKFDINWEHNDFRNKWKMFWWRRKLNLEKIKRFFKK